MEQLSLLHSIQQVRYLESIGESIQFNLYHQLLKFPERWHNFQLTFLRWSQQCLGKVNLMLRRLRGCIQSHPFVSGHGYERERDWLENIKELLCKEELTKDDAVSWATYRASQVSLSYHEPAIISLLPLFVENAHSTAMILHAINVIRSAVKHVNPVQVPVIAFDQPVCTGQTDSMGTAKHTRTRSSCCYVWCIAC